MDYKTERLKWNIAEKIRILQGFSNSIKENLFPICNSEDNKELFEKEIQVFNTINDLIIEEARFLADLK